MTTKTTQTCADFYANPAVRKLLGESLHPGGMEVTRRLLEALQLQPGGKVLDVAAGTGATAKQLCKDFKQTVVAIDASAGQSDSLRQQARSEALPLRALVADAASLPFPDNSFDAVVCECAVSTFEDKHTALGEIARVLRPGGTFGMSDMLLRNALPGHLAAFAGPWSCLGEALHEDGYVALCREAGLEPGSFHEEAGSLEDTLRQMKRQLLAAGMGELAGLMPGGLELDFPHLRSLLREADGLVRDGTVSYGWWVFKAGPRT